MKNYFIFSHGFGFDNNFWKNLIPLLVKNLVKNNYSYLNDSSDINFDKVRLIGVGHSLGLPKLLMLNKKFDYLIGLNGFINFLGDDIELHNKRKHELATLKKNFVDAPLNTMQRFYKRCGILNYEHCNFDVLNDFDLLSQSFVIPDDTSTLIIGSDNDVIVPKEILYDNFNEHANIEIEIIQDGKHGLGFVKADEVAKKIMSYIND